MGDFDNQEINPTVTPNFEQVTTSSFQNPEIPEQIVQEETPLIIPVTGSNPETGTSSENDNTEKQDIETMKKNLESLRNQVSDLTNILYTFYSNQYEQSNQRDLLSKTLIDLGGLRQKI